MTAVKTPLSDELEEVSISSLHRHTETEIERVARDQNRQPVDVTEDAVCKYPEDQKWQSLMARSQQRAFEQWLSGLRDEQ